MSEQDQGHSSSRDVSHTATVGHGAPTPHATSKLNGNERAVLRAIGADGSDVDWRAYPFRSIQRYCGLDIPAIRRACRSLARKGLAAHERGLMTEDGDLIGSGYRATAAGAHIYWSDLVEDKV